jgi:GNAT superfamily N-acetyltransferase
MGGVRPGFAPEPICSRAWQIQLREKGVLRDQMSEEFEIVQVDKPEWGIIGPGISEYNTQQAGNDNGQNLCFVLRSPGEEIVGGVIGATYWDWLHVDLMWIKEEFRGRGYGHRLLMLAEEEARKRGAKNAYLDTFSFQAPDFYKQHGYRVFGELADFPTAHQRYFLTKEL